MLASELIAKKRDGQTLTQEEIEFFVRSYTKEEIPDYQASAFLMAAFLRGLDRRETSYLTQAMVRSGDVLDLSSVSGIKVDKHSTGGVGDGISLALAPLVAACGVPVPMISGRALGHTGGTLDKLESIPGFRVDLSASEFTGQLGSIGLCMIGQTEAMAPADKKLYALRDVTGTVESIPLISASILSKKIVEGTDALVLDVKTGSGAFMREIKDAVALAKSLLDIGRRARKKMIAVVTDMNQPLGKAVGNALEIETSIGILKGREEPAARDFVELTEVLGGWMLFFGGAAKNHHEGMQKIRQARLNGSGLRKFAEMVRAQGGDPSVCENPKFILPQAKFTKTVLSPWKGFVNRLEAKSAGIAALLLGAGRRTKESPIDPAAGILIFKKVGDRVERGEAIAEFRTKDKENVDAAEKTFFSGLKITKIKPKPIPLIHQVIRS